MNSIHLIAGTFSGAGLLICLLAIPMILRRVPPNGLYGVRTKASFASKADWYRINAIGGRYLAVGGMLILVAGLVGFFLPGSARDSYSIGAGVVTLLAVLIPCIRLCAMKPTGSPK